MATIDFDINCIGCGTSLRGVALDGTCARCGSTVGRTLYLPAIDTETATVRQDIPCTQCKYNLRTLPVRSVCPECGSPVAPSLDPRELVFADRGWLKQQRAIAT